MLHLLDSITDVGPSHAGGVAVSGSHGGVYPATVASVAGLRAVIFNDAGIGLDRAGVAGVEALDGIGMAAAAADCMSCEIGSAQDMQISGRISVVNAAARGCGVVTGQPVTEAAQRLLDAAHGPGGTLPKIAEARAETRLPGLSQPIALLDSASLVNEADEGRIIITGSHGGLIGGNPARALKARARIAAFNDAGGGKNAVGITRLPALDIVGVAAVTVAHDTARIGQAASTLETGVISAVNETARTLGAVPGVRLSQWLIGLPA